MLIAEAHGESEELIGRPLVGYSGLELARMLTQTHLATVPLPDRFIPKEVLPQFMDQWWSQQDIFCTNVLPFRPPENKLPYLCGTKKEVGGKAYVLPPMLGGTTGPKYLLPEYLPELKRLAIEIRLVQPNLIIALGNIACWALLRRTGITAIRGTTAECLLVSGFKVLPTFHPSNILRQWENRTIMLSDLIKAKREAEFPEIRRPQREILVNPTIEEIEDFLAYLQEYNFPLLSIDIETKGKTITMISFAPAPNYALVIPFYDEAFPNGNYWSSPELEIKAWMLVKRLLELPIPKLFQNGLYDLQYIYKMGFRPKNVLADTMLLHHAILPEMQKGLGFLGSIYTFESSWKLLRRVRVKDLGNKADE